uniref:Uncharacterized protein n=1 Tax=Fusarium oxysporum (strain Fo5176) TaxID=660025 RepID=A0A0D2YJQ4_FUSOF
MQRIQSQASNLCHLTEQPNLSTTDTTPTSGTANEARQLHIEIESSITSPSHKEKSPPIHTASRRIHSGNKLVKNNSKVTALSPRKERSSYTTVACTNRRSRLPEESDELKHVAAQVTLLQDEVTRLHEAVGNAQVISVACPILGDVLPSTEMSSENDPLIQVTQSPLQGFSARCVGHSVPENPTSPANGFANFSNVLADMEFEGLQQADDYFVQRPENDMKERQVDPLFIFNKDEMIRLCRLYEEAFDCMLPVISVQSLITHTENLTSVESVKDQMSPEPTSGIEMLQLKVVICCALVIQGGDQGEKAARIYENMGNITDQMIKQGDIDKELPLPIKVSNLPGGRLSLTARSQDLDRPKTLICFKLLQRI